MNKFNEVIASIANEQPDSQASQEAGERVRRNLFGITGVAQVAGRIQSCDDYRGLIPAYLQKTISDSRRMLLEDHVRECVNCRKALGEKRSGAPAKVHVMPPPAKRTEYKRWAIAAAVIAAIMGGEAWYTGEKGVTGGTLALVDSVQGDLYQVSDRGSTPVHSGRQLAAGETIRAGRGGHSIVSLLDGSIIEMNERAEISVSRGFGGTTIQLERGNIIVQAAKQKNGKLFVASGDSLVSVKGTIFSVNRGTKGTRVSVVEGAVQVDRASNSQLLKPGEQTTSDASLTKIPVEDEISWSRDSARYIALLGELSALQNKLSAIPSPALRYQSKLLKYVPADAALFAAIPNIGEQLRQARTVFEEQTRSNPILRSWWANQGPTADQLLASLDRLQTLSTYIGEEAVLIARPHGSYTLLAEVISPGLDEFLHRELGNKIPWKIIGGTLVMASDIAGLQLAASPSTPFRDRIAQAYAAGAGWLLCLNAQQLHLKGDQTAVDLGVENVDYLVLERRDIASRTENTASINFGTQRRGVASWLGAPGPLSTLDFVSPEAGAAFAFVMKNPRQAVEEVLAGLRQRNPRTDQELSKIEAQLGVKIIDDIAAPLGSEMTIAQDGPLLPDLSWKFAAEVNAPQTLEHSIEKLASQIPEMKLTSTEQGGRTYYQLSGKALPMAVHYTFADGYLVAAPSQSLVAQALDNKRRGYTLARSEKFRAQLPAGGSPNFSALVYHNISQVTGPVTEQLKKLNVMTKEQSVAASKLQDMAPGLIYVYGEADRISISSAGAFFGMDLGVLAGLDRGLPFVLSKGLIPKGLVPSHQ